MRIDEKGQLEMRVEGGFLIEDAPKSYQIVEGRRVEVKTRYVIDKNYDVRFVIGEYDSRDFGGAVGVRYVD